MSQIIVMRTEGDGAPVVEHGETPKEIYISGATDSRTWNHFTGEENRLNCGIWERSPGKVKADFKWWEFFQKAMDAAKEFDKATGQPDCVDPEKDKWRKEVEERLEALEKDSGTQPKTAH